MKLFKYKYLIFNTLLCLLILLLVRENYAIWNHPIDLLPDKGIALKRLGTENEDSSMIASTIEPMAGQSYKLISENNIFSPERKDFPASQLSFETPKPNLRPRVTLYGVAIAADYQSATISNPGRAARKEERETFTIKIGEQIGEYKLAKILPDRIALESNGDSFEVLLYDPQNPKQKKEVRSEAKLAMAPNPQPAPASPSVEAANPSPPQESVEKPKEPVQARAVAFLPYNRYTYQKLGPSTAILRGKIVPIPSAPSAQESAGK